MAYPDTKGSSVGDLELVGGQWYILHRPIGSGLQAKWVYDQNVHNFMRSMGATRVEGSGDNMKIYAGAGDDAIVLDLGNQQDLNVFAQLYGQVVGPQDVDISAYEQGAPVDLKQLWNQVYGPSIPFPDISAVDDFGRAVTSERTGQIIPDIQKYNEVIDALEARVGPLSQYGLDTDAGYQLINLGDEYESDIVISDGKVTKIDKVDPPKAAAPLKPGEYEVGPGGLRRDIGVSMPGYDVLEQRTGELSAIQQRVDPGYIIDPKTMQPYFQQPDGSLQAAPTPSVDDQISMHLVEGNMDAAVSKANFRDRPTSMEYFNAAMDWARTPADIFTISAIVRGVFEPTPGPMGELRRVGAPPAWATQAWVGLQNSMGIPTENMTSTPGAEPGTVNAMTVASSSGLVPNNFISANSAPTTLDGGQSVTQPTPAPTAAPTGPITPDTTVQALDASGNPVGSMTADMANNQGFSFAGQGGANDQSTAASTIVPPPEAAAGQNLKHIWDVEAQDYISLNINDPDSLAQYNWYLERDGYLGEGQEGFGERDIGTFAGAMGGGGGAASLATQYMNLQSQWEAANPGMQIRDVPGFFEASAGGPQAQIDWLNAINLAEGAADAEFDREQFDREVEEQRQEVLERFRQEQLLEGEGDLGDGDFGAALQELGTVTDLSEWYEEALERGPTERFVREDPEAVGGITDDTDDYAPTEVRSFADLLEAARARDFEREAEAFDEGIGFDYGTFDLYGGGLEGDWGTIPTGVPWRQPQIPVGRGGGDVSSRTPFGSVPFEPMSAAEQYPGMSADATELIDMWRGMSEGEMWGDPATSLGPQPSTSSLPVGPSHLSTPRPARVVTEVPDLRTRQQRFKDELFPEGAPYVDLPDYREVGDESMEPAGFQYEEPDEEPFDYYEPEPEPEPMPEPYFAPAPAPAPTYVAPEIFEEDMGFVWSDPEPESAERWYDEGAEGIRTRDRMALVGESGPEIALFPNGTEIIPLDRKMKSDQARRLRRRGEFAKTIDAFEFGGFIGDMGPEVSDLPPSAQVMPAGVSEMMTGRPTRAPRSLMRQAGMRAPSAQTISNLLPEEIEVYQEMGRLAGIPEKAFEREFRSMVPMGQGGTRQARFTPRRTGRTRYGSI